MANEMECVRVNVQGSQHIVKKDDLSVGVNRSCQRKTGLVSSMSMSILRKMIRQDRTFWPPLLRNISKYIVFYEI